MSGEGKPDEGTTIKRAKFTLRVIAKLDSDEVLVRFERPPGAGHARYETLRLSYDEAEWLRQALMDELG